MPEEIVFLTVSGMVLTATVLIAIMRTIGKVTTARLAAQQTREGLPAGELRHLISGAVREAVAPMEARLERIETALGGAAPGAEPARRLAPLDDADPYLLAEAEEPHRVRTRAGR